MKKMSAAAACTQLKAALAPFGFQALKPDTFWGKTAEIVQVVELARVRHAAGKIEVTLGIWRPIGADAPLIIERPWIIELIGDTRFTASGAWDLDQFDAADVARRIYMTGASFKTGADIVRHFSDRYTDAWVSDALGDASEPAPLAALPAPALTYPTSAVAPSGADTTTMLRAMDAILFAHWLPCPGLGPGYWGNPQEDGGFRYCAYLLPNQTGTVASIHYFSATVADLTRQSDAAASRMHRATKHAVRHGTLALQLPVTAHTSLMLAEARAAILQQLASTPANALLQI